MAKTRREQATQRALMQSVAQTAVVAASNAVVITSRIDDAVSGDLVAQSPALAAKLQDLQDQIDGISGPIP